MSLPTANLNHLWAGLLVEELVRCGTRCFFVSPGSRSTPLTTAVARHESARAVLHYDERGSAFAALGYARATGRPAGWVTTSGTAVANGLPAAAEAAADGIPLLLLTADRPPEKRFTGANQTIPQPGLFGEHARWQFDLPAPTREIAPEMLLTTASRAVRAARGTPPGPVHLNCMFRKPLEPTDDGERYDGYLAGLTDWRAGDAPYTRRPLPVAQASSETLDRLAEALRRAERGLVMCGRLDGAEPARAARRLARRLGWPLLPDATSRLRLAGGVAAHFDQVLTSASFRKAHAPEAVLHLGGRTVSKRLRLFLKEHRPTPYVVARPDPRRLDPDHRVTDQIETAVAPFCDALAERLEPSTPGGARDDWAGDWARAEQAATHAVDAFADEADALSEPLVARLVSRHRPAGGALVLGSSMPVRDFNRYARGGAEGDVTPVFANRGASGIDGTVATAAGVAEGRSEGEGGPVTLVLGDLALLHDLNALPMLRGRPVTVVVVNNGGGGIFHFLPIADHAEVFEPHFTTPHAFSFERAADLFGLAYAQPDTPGAFAQAYREHSRSGAPALIEVRTDRGENRALHDRLEARVAHAVEES